MEAVELFPQLDDAEASVTKLSAGSLALPTTLASMRTVSHAHGERSRSCHLLDSH